MYPSSGLLEKRIIQVVGENLDWFFKRILHDHYGRRRQVVTDGNQDIKLIPAIDYIIRTRVNESAVYPPESVAQWHEYFQELSYCNHLQHLLIVYLKLDVANYLAVRERESKSGRQTRARDRTELQILEDALKNLKNLIQINDFNQAAIKLSTGLWALDNDQLGLMINCLSNPSIALSKFFDEPKEIVRLIVGTLQQCGNPRMALFMSRIHRQENWDSDYDQMYSYLLLGSNQLIEALKYERIFADSDNYHGILQGFFELCSRLDVIKSLNRLNLSVEEEDVLNQHMPILPSNDSSRAVTPSTSQHQIKRVTITESATMSRSKTSNHTPRNRSVQQLKKMPSFSDSPARNTRSARKKKVH